MAVRNVALGEIVSVALTEHGRFRGKHSRQVRVRGVVTDFDDRGIHVQLARPVNGVWTCYATYEEVSHTGIPARI